MGDGSQPLISHYYGERNTEAVKGLRNLAYKTAAIITVVCMAGVYLARAKVGILFGASADANAGVVQYLPYFLATLLFLAFVRITTSYFYAAEKTVLSYVLVYAEPVCTLLLLLILPPMLKLTAAWKSGAKRIAGHLLRTIRLPVCPLMKAGNVSWKSLK